MKRDKGLTLVETAVAAAIFSFALLALIGLQRQFERKQDRRDALMSLRAELSWAMEGVLRAVRDAGIVLEADGLSVLVQNSSGTYDLWHLEDDPEGTKSLAVVRDLPAPMDLKHLTAGSGLPSESVVVSGLTTGAILPLAAPALTPGAPPSAIHQPNPILSVPPGGPCSGGAAVWPASCCGKAVSVFLQKRFADGEWVQVASVALCRNGRIGGNFSPP